MTADVPGVLPEGSVPGGVLTRRGAPTPFEVHLDVFDGPFDLLLGLISKHKLDITEIALAQVTDEFVAHIRAAQRAADEGGAEWDLSQASEFLLVAATLLDLKAARLLPSAGPDDEEDLALIEARDLLFARLLQYRAYKQIAGAFAERMDVHGRARPRQAGLEPRFAALLPELVMTVTPEQLAMIAARVLTPKAPPQVGLAHLHAPQVSVREQAALVAARLRARGTMSFRALVADADSTLVIVARFLALLELFKERVVAFDQAEALGDLTVRWTGEEGQEVQISGDFDEPARPDGPVVAGDPVTEREGDPSDEELATLARQRRRADDIPPGQEVDQ
ncbi:segregation and condensation protein A [Arsenicicoccus dermatophilus]|uniref:segregation and condensation protein A n=1 Tax=Arsenicicoccus dermatophilus TaxID=1076331 RepID=UPI001F4D1D70|nr:ScpA family protein [Arsenicicoccus dermatophilus]MCH8613012.1 segregation/condensation protein A [Arsenicicoccus dermatophilus]